MLVCLSPLSLQLFLEWVVRYLLLSKPDLVRLLFKAFDSSKRGDMSRAGMLTVIVCMFVV